MHPPDYWVNHLKLFPHPEGGFYKETYRSNEVISKQALPDQFDGERNISTAIYFLLRSQDKSLFHKIKSDEIWHFHDGSSLTLYVLDESGLATHKLGLDLSRGQSPQVIIPAHSWFGAIVDDLDAYTLAGCTVAPGFYFSDFELAKREVLIKEFPDQKNIIELLTQ